MQETLWNALTAFEQSHPGVVRLDWEQVRADPLGTSRELAVLAGVGPSDEQFEAAGAFIGHD